MNKVISSVVAVMLFFAAVLGYYFYREHEIEILTNPDEIDTYFKECISSPYGGIKVEECQNRAADAGRNRAIARLHHPELIRNK